MDFLERAPRNLFFTGKGGVGKTSVACATAVALIAMLVLLFASEGWVMVDRPLLVTKVALPPLLSTGLLVALGFFIAPKLRFSFEDAVMVALIGGCTQFEPAIATAVLAFGFGSGAGLATVVGPLTEAPSIAAVARLLQRFRQRPHEEPKEE